MNDSQRKMVGISWLEMYDSLHQATQNAGGSGGFCAADKLHSLTVTELFCHLATNGVRFYCTKTHCLVAQTTRTAYHPDRVKGSGDIKK